MTDLNRTNVQLLRDTLAKHYLAGEGVLASDGRRVGFNMLLVFSSRSSDDDYLTDHIDDCGTVGCLAGHCLVLSDDRTHGHWTNGSWIDAAKWLGLALRPEAHALFFPDTDFSWSSITVPEALVVIDYLLATGEVDWSLVAQRREHIKQGGYVPVSPVYGRPEAVPA